MFDLRHRLQYTLRRRQFDADLAEEMEFHRASTQDELETRGHSPAEAARASRRAFGSATLAHDQVNDVLVWPWLRDAARDVRYAARALRKSPGFSAVAILTIALGIGANTAIFSLLNAVLLRSLPVESPEQLVFFGNATASGSTGFFPNGNTRLFSYPFFRDFRRDNPVFSDVAAIGSVTFGASGRVGQGAGFEKLKIELVSGSYFETLGVNAAVGRTLTDADDQVPGGHPLAVASHAWWQRRFGAAPSITGTTVSIGSRIYTIVGVAGQGFSGVTVGQSPDLWIPLAMQKEISPGWNGLDQNLFQSLHMLARLKPGVSQAQAQADTDLRFRRTLRSYAGDNPTGRRLDNIQRAYISLTPAASGRSDLRAQFSSPLKILMAVVAVVLLIACANVANLLLARATARQREIAVRMSLGAGRWRLVRQLLAESLVLGTAGAVTGTVLASAANRLLISIVSTGTEPVPLTIAPDLAVLAFTLAATLLTVFVFGVVPALQATRLDLVPTLKDGGNAASGRTRLGRSLVVGQVALSLVLIAGAVLFLRSLTNVLDIDTGFDKRNVIVARIDPGSAGYQLDARLDTMMTRVEERVTLVPGIRSASFAFFVFNGGGWTTDDVQVPGRMQTDADPQVDLNVVGPGYFDVMRMPIVAGRALAARDSAASPKVAVINETMARTHFGGVNPLGRTFSVHDDEKNDTQWDNMQVVGVVKDAKYITLDEKQMPAVFFPHAQHQRHFLFNFVARYADGSGAILPAIQKAVAEIDPNLPVGDATTLTQRVDDSVVNKRAVAQLSAFFGILAALLACIGIYGVTSYGIARRTNEFGIRMALGADRKDVLWLVLNEALGLGVAGVAIGVVLALVAGRFISSLLFGLRPYNPAALGAAVFAMIAVAMLAGYLPARRATRIEPVTALRHD